MPTEKTTEPTPQPIPSIEAWISVHATERPKGFPQEPHREYWQWIAETIQPIEVVPIEDHPRRIEIEAAIEVIQPEYKECHSNAAKIAALIEDAQVVQGLSCALMTVEHSWNCLDGIHFDATGERVLARFGKGYTEYGQILAGGTDLPSLFEHWRQNKS